MASGWPWSSRPARTATAFAVTALVVGAALGVRRNGLDAPSRTTVWRDGLANLAHSLAVLDSTLGRGDTTSARAAFRVARRDFKRIEGLLYFHSRSLIALINSPRIDDDDAPNPLPLATPIGFQTVEAALFDDEPSLDSARRETGNMRWVVDQIRSVASHTEITDTTLVEAARLEIARVTTLGLAGFDAGSSGDAVTEASEALEGLQRQLALVDAPDSLSGRADETLGYAVAELRRGKTLETLNRLRFIASFAEPAARAVNALRKYVEVPAPGIRSTWRHEAASVFDHDAFDPEAYAPAQARKPTPELVALGRRLFFDPRLSGPGTHSCSTCHDPARGFTDGRPRAKPLQGTRNFALRNTPTLLNAAFQPTFFADARARSFEAQVGVVLTSPAEMAGSPERAAVLLQGDPSYREAFARAMPDRRDSAITGQNVREAIGAYERSLTAMDSRFDRAVRGDTLALTAEERTGFTLFLGKGRCGTCHFAPLFNGVQPPDFREAEPEIIGVTADTNFHMPRLDPDLGRGAVEISKINRFAFKVPTLRNIDLTAPYMHNGVYPTLERVIDFYDAGGGAGLGANVPNPTLASDSLHLSGADKKALVAFLRSLTDTSFLRPTARP